MGKLTDSLKATTKQLGEIKQGIQQMQSLGHELADNTLTVADAALRTGYAYAKAEAAAMHELPLLAAAPTILDAELLQGPAWTEAALKQRFGSFRAACQYLSETYAIQPTPRSWQAAIAIFNGATPTVDRSIEQRLIQLEQTIHHHNQRLVTLEAQVDRVLQHLQAVTATPDSQTQTA